MGRSGNPQCDRKSATIPVDLLPVRFWEGNLDLQKEVRDILRDVLSLGPRADRLEPGSALLGAVPELDSMAVVGVIAALEDRFGFTVDDDEITGATFATFGTLVDFVASKTA